jgi:hypothetical protein
MEEDDGRWLLPIVKFDGTEYLVDVEQREFREFKNPNNVVNMHSEKGRRIVNEISGRQWDSFGVDSCPRKGMEV